MKVLGHILPLVRRVKTPCDEFGVPTNGKDAALCRYETKAIVFAWLGGCFQFGYGDFSPRETEPRVDRLREAMRNAGR